jgi:ferredoxin-NADP reductase
VLESPPDDWQGESGLITPQVLDRHLPRELIHRNFFICGPEPMMNAVHAALMKQGIARDCVHMERFNLA